MLPRAPSRLSVVVAGPLFCALFAPAAATPASASMTGLLSLAAPASSSPAGWLPSWSPFSFSGSSGFAADGAAGFPSTVHAPGDAEIVDEAAEGPPAPQHQRQKVALAAKQHVPPHASSLAGGARRKGRKAGQLRHDPYAHQLRNLAPTVEEYDEDLTGMTDTTDEPDAQPAASMLALAAARRKSTVITHNVSTMRQICMEFAAVLKSGDVVGEGLEHAFKSGCALIVMQTRNATSIQAQHHEEMCRYVSCAVAAYNATGPDWGEEPVCDVVVEAFLQTDLGASPLVP